MKNKRVLITGESGHLGWLLKNRLKLLGAIIINDKYKQLASHNKRSIPNVFDFDYENELDISKESVIGFVIKESKPDVVIHTAAFVGSDKCEIDWKGAFDINVNCTYNLTSILNFYVPDCLFINFSTTASMDTHCYGIRNKINENTKRLPETWYGQTKLLGERIIKENYKKWINFLPVFLFYKYPYDNASIWAKLFYKSNQNKSLDIQLDPKIYKQYEYSENLIDIMIKIIKNKKSINKDVVLTGSEISKFGKFLDIARRVYEEEHGKHLKYKLIPKLDYLKNHVADNSLMLSLSNTSSEQYCKNRKNFSESIKEVVLSC